MEINGFFLFQDVIMGDKKMRAEKFTGKDKLFPVELFVQGLENELTDHFQLYKEAIGRLSTDLLKVAELTWDGLKQRR